MSKHIVNGFITRTAYGLDDKEPTIDFRTYRPTAEYAPNTVVVREHSIEVEIPDNFDPRPAMLELLEEQKREAREKFAATVMQIDRRISQLLALENSVETV